MEKEIPPQLAAGYPVKSSDSLETPLGGVLKLRPSFASPSYAKAQRNRPILIEGECTSSNRLSHHKLLEDNRGIVAPESKGVQEGCANRSLLDGAGDTS